MTWTDAAISTLLSDVDRTEAEVGERFPLSADPATGAWTTTRSGSWTGGFWAGRLWLRALLTGDPAHLTSARRCADRLSGRWAADTVTRGMVCWYGAVAGARLGLDTAAAEPARAVASALAGTVDEAVVPWGTAFGDPAAPVLARSDGLPGTVSLLAWSGHADVAARHLRTHVRLEAELGGHAWTSSVDGWSTAPDPPAGWSRGEAWLLLGLADGARWLDPAFGELGRQRAAELPGDFPAVRTVAGSPPDSSAAAITAVALAKLGRTAEAEALVRTVLREHVRDGRLVDGCHDLHRGAGTSHQLVWGDFFLLLAVVILSGAVAPDRI